MIFLKKQHEKGLSWLITIFIFRQLDINLHLGPDHIQFNCILNFIKPNCRPKCIFIYCITEEIVLEELMVPHITHKNTVTRRSRVKNRFLEIDLF